MNEFRAKLLTVGLGWILLSWDWFVCVCVMFVRISEPVWFTRRLDCTSERLNFILYCRVKACV